MAKRRLQDRIRQLVTGAGPVAVTAQSGAVAARPASEEADLRLLEISIELTKKCNLTCVMCSVWKGALDGIPGELVRDILRDARRLGATAFSPSGAESFMRKDFLDILETAQDLGFERIEVVTNGILVPAHADRLARLAGLTLHVSIDGPPDIHDRLRGAGSYERAMRGVHAALERGIRTELSGVLMAPTLGTAGHIIDLAAELGLGRVSFQPFQPEIAGSGGDHSDWTFPPEQRQHVAEDLEALLRIAESAGVEIFTKSVFPHIVPYLFDGLRPIPAGGCFLPSRFLLIDSKGDSYPCFFMRGQSMGNVQEGVSLREIWDGHARRSLANAAQRRNCPGCLAACSDIATFKGN